MAKEIKKTENRGGARSGSGPKSYIPNPERIIITVPGEHKEELRKKFNAMADKYRVQKD